MITGSIALSLFSLFALGAQVQLPVPTGPFSVGRIAYHWTDPSRPEPLSPEKGARRELMVTLWYPAARVRTARRTAPYLPDFAAVQKVVTEKDLNDLFRPASYATLQKSGLPSTHAVENVRIAPSPIRFPVLVFSHGWGNPTLLYTAELEDLASHGYVIAAIDHTYDTTFTVFPDGRIVPFAQKQYDAAVKKPHGYIDYAFERVEVMAADTRFVIDQLTRYDQTPTLGAPFAGHLDLQHIGAFGHSIGGLASARAGQLDSRIRACIDQDSTDDRGSPFTVITPESSLTQPFLLFIGPSSDIFSDHALHPSDKDLTDQKLTRAQYDAIIQKQLQTQNELLAHIGGGSYRVMLCDVPGFTHRSFSDLPLLAAEDDPTKATEHLRCYQIALSYTRAFFDKFLKGVPDTLLDHEGSDRVDPKVKVERFPPLFKSPSQ